MTLKFKLILNRLFDNRKFGMVWFNFRYYRNCLKNKPNRSPKSSTAAVQTKLLKTAIFRVQWYFVKNNNFSDTTSALKQQYSDFMGAFAKSKLMSQNRKSYIRVKQFMFSLNLIKLSKFKHQRINYQLEKYINKLGISSWVPGISSFRARWDLRKEIRLGKVWLVSRGVVAVGGLVDGEKGAE